MYYSSRDIKQIELYKFTQTKEDQQDAEELTSTSIGNFELAKLKNYFAKNPLEDFDIASKKELFKCREHYQTHPLGLPIFLKSIQWDRPIQVNEVYKMLDNWALMTPEESIQLLDAKYPDEHVRQYAVKRIAKLSDDEIALYMLQFSQALLYEVYHMSPLAEMLIQRGLSNPYVVGHSLYWNLRSNLYLKPSYERYYVILEKFLGLVGRFVETFTIQTQVNNCLKHVSQTVIELRYKHKMDVKALRPLARKRLALER